MAYTFEQIFAVDEANTSNVAADSSVLIFAPGDAAKTPLTITTTDGQPLANPVPVNANGFGPAFIHDTLDRVAWEGGGFTGFFTSYEGMKDEAVAARSAAENAAAEAATSASLVNAPADTAVETLINGTGTATRAALDATYAPKSLETSKLDKTEAASTYGRVAGARPGNKCVYLGDSLTQWQDNPELFSQRVSTANLASILSNQRIRYARNAGIGGDTTAQMLARFDADVTPYSPNVVHLLGGTNDTGTVADTISNITAIVAKIRGIGAVPVIGTPPPKNGAATAERQRLAALAAGIKRYAEREGITIVDYRRALVDPATGGLLAAYNLDNTHPTDAGFTVMGQLAADTISPILPAWSPPLANENADPNNLIANGLFLDSGATGTGRLSWTGGGSATGITPSVITEDTAIRGNWLKWDIAASATTMQCYQNVTTAPVPGNRYMFAGKIKTSWTSGANMFQIRNRITTGSSVDIMPMNNMSVTLPDGTFYAGYDCPAGATAQQISILAAAGTGSIQVAQMTLYNLTAMGIA